MPVRTLKKSYRSQLSLLMSRKAVNPSVFCESTLERDFHKLLEFMPWVISFEEQPMKIPYVDANGRPGKYTPDTLTHLQFDDDFEKWIFEVKYRKDLRENWSEYRHKFRGAVHHCKAQGYDRFKIVTEVEIRSGYKLKNVKLFLKNRNSSINPDLLECITRVVGGNGTILTRSLLELATDKMRVDQNEVCRGLYHLIANHRVGLDLDAEFTYQSDLWLLPEPASQSGSLINLRGPI